MTPPYFYLDRGTVLHRLDGLTKLLLFCGNCALGLLHSSPRLLSGVAAFLLLQLAAARALPNLRRVALFLVVASAFTVAVWTLTRRGPTPVVLWVTAEGVAAGAAAALRIDAFVLAGALFLSTTRNEEIVQALRRLRIPYPACFAFSIALRLAPAFVGTGWAVRQAQRARGLDPDSGGIAARLRKNVPLLVPTILTTLRMTGHLAMSLESKGFGLRPDRTFLHAGRPGWRDAAALAAMAAAIAASGCLR